MESRIRIGQELQKLFRMEEWSTDPAFSRFIPIVYDPIGFDWRSFFTDEFVQRFNGFMLEGREAVRTVFLAVFPSDDVLERFISQAQPGDLLFMHHPLLMECGDPRGDWGKGFVPIRSKWLEAMKEKELSVFTSHLPMDTSIPIGTGGAIIEALGAKIIRPFVPYGNGYVGHICRIDETSTETLLKQVTELFDIPYADFEGKRHDLLHTIAIVPGCGDVVADMQEAELLGAQAYITGEIHCHIDNPYGKQRYAQMMDYVPSTSLSLIGVSHSASEYLVMKTQMKLWFERNFPAVNVRLLPQEKWWL
ncbi:Nif3-like dinuclear metal center hexameric protein [Brevibacillus reuszeri]|uniref:Nif3-like dinuclear metal center hexameric protein n=1 Tax=Brevibacillus reuszeri TaxID=54915 RepID=UPI000CCBE814|nr:Nif3-like dinuclear metal center hexameric protein [Brevibacillus reuszeri]